MVHYGGVIQAKDIGCYPQAYAAFLNPLAELLFDRYVFGVAGPFDH